MNLRPTSAGPTTLDIVTLVVAVVGVALAASSLAWQATSFMLSGSRVRLRLRRGAVQRYAGGRVGRISGPLVMSEKDLDMMRGQGFTDEVAIVEVRNIGRMAVSVESVSLDADDGWGFAHPGDPDNPDLPHRLEPGSKASWHIPLAPLHKLVNIDGVGRSARMTVELGTGKALRTSNEIRIHPRREPTDEAQPAN